MQRCDVQSIPTQFLARNFLSRPIQRIDSCDFSEDSGLLSGPICVISRQRSFSHKHAIEWVLNCRILCTNICRRVIRDDL
jgi:hypothetical protein